MYHKQGRVESSGIDRHVTFRASSINEIVIEGITLEK